MKPRFGTIRISRDIYSDPKLIKDLLLNSRTRSRTITRTSSNIRFRRGEIKIEKYAARLGNANAPKDLRLKSNDVALRESDNIVKEKLNRKFKLPDTLSIGKLKKKISKILQVPMLEPIKLTNVASPNVYRFGCERHDKHEKHTANKRIQGFEYFSQDSDPSKFQTYFHEISTSCFEHSKTIKEMKRKNLSSYLYHSKKTPFSKPPSIPNVPKFSLPTHTTPSQSIISPSRPYLRSWSRAQSISNCNLP